MKARGGLRLWTWGRPIHLSLSPLRYMRARDLQRRREVEHTQGHSGPPWPSTPRDVVLWKEGGRERADRFVKRCFIFCGSSPCAYLPLRRKIGPCAVRAFFMRTRAGDDLSCVRSWDMVIARISKCYYSTFSFFNSFEYIRESRIARSLRHSKLMK